MVYSIENVTVNCCPTAVNLLLISTPLCAVGQGDNEEWRVTFQSSGNAEKCCQYKQKTAGVFNPADHVNLISRGHMIKSGPALQRLCPVTA